MPTKTHRLIQGHEIAREVAEAIERAAIPHQTTTGTFTYGDRIKTFRFPPKPIEVIVIRANATPRGPGEVLSRPHLTIFVRSEDIKKAMVVVDRLYEMFHRKDPGLDTLNAMFTVDATEEPYFDETNFPVVPIGLSCFAHPKIRAA